MSHLLADMKPAMKSVTELTLCVIHEHIRLADTSVACGSETNEGRSLRHQQQQQQGATATTMCPKGLGVVAGSVFALLSAAVPNLQKVSLRGCCWDAALPSFGASCPHLISLDIQIPNVPIEALDDFGLHLPGLMSLSLANTLVSYFAEPEVTCYLQKLLRATQHCANLTYLEIEFAGRISLSLSNDAWLLIPRSLKHLMCDCDTLDSDSFITLKRRVQSLCLAEGHWSFPDCLKNFPVMKRLDIMLPGVVYVLCRTRIEILGEIRDNSHSRLGAFREWIWGKGCFLKCNDMRFHGSGKQILEVFSWLPQMPHVKNLTVVLEDNSMPLCLKDIPRLFPTADSLMIFGRVSAQSGVWGDDVLSLLAAQQCIKLLVMRCRQLAITAAGLVVLSHSFPCLEKVTILGEMIQGFSSEGELQAEIKKLGLETRMTFL